jgi:hypothetical protein
VRSRTGVYGVPDAVTAGTASRAERLVAALVSPFAAPDLGLRLQALFVDDEKMGPTLRAILRIDGRDLTFVERPGGGWQVVLDVVAVTLGSGAAAVDRQDQTFTLGTPGAARPGSDTAFYYTMDVPATKPGAYQLRLVGQDTATERLGAASEVVVVPDLKAAQLALSGVFVNGVSGQAPAGRGCRRRSASGTKEGRCTRARGPRCPWRRQPSASPPAGGSTWEPAWIRETTRSR